MKRALRAGLFLSDQISRPFAWVGMKAYGAHPRPPERNPLAFALVAAVAFINTPLATGSSPLPPALGAAPDGFGRVAVIVLVVGAFGVMLGKLWPGNDTRLLIENLGLASFGFGMLCYGAAILANSGWDTGRVVISLSWGISVGTGLRYWQLWYYLYSRRLHR